jgi:hypothetical protein
LRGLTLPPPSTPSVSPPVVGVDGSVDPVTPPHQKCRRTHARTMDGQTRVDGMDGHTNRQIDRQIDRMDRWTDGQTRIDGMDGHTNKWWDRADRGTP